MVADPVKSSEYPEQDARTAPFQKEESASALVRREPSAQTPAPEAEAPMDPRAARNLILGVVLLTVAALGLWMGYIFAGGAALRTMIACFGTFGIICLLYQLRVLRQRYGALFGAGVIAVFGAAIPFVEGGFRELDGMARDRVANSETANHPASLPPVTTATAPPAPPTIPLPDAGVASLSAEAPEEPIAAAPKKSPLNTRPSVKDPTARELIVPEPPPNAGKLIRVKEDVKVDLDGRPTIITAGTIAPFKSLQDGQVTFMANDHEIQVDMEYVTFTGVSKENPAQITKMAQLEAVRRYPMLGVEDSKENILYITRMKELQLDAEAKAVFFGNPQWPLVLAEQLAEQENWNRADLPPTDEEVMPAEDAAPVPANEQPAAPEGESLLPKPSPVPDQASEPPPAR